MPAPSSPPPRPSLELPQLTKRLWGIVAAVVGAVVLVGGGFVVMVGNAAEDDEAADPTSPTTSEQREPAPPSPSTSEPERSTKPKRTKQAEPTQEPAPPEEPAAEGVLVIEVTSSGSDTGLITYVDPLGDAFEVEPVADASLPWRQEWTGVDSLPMGWNTHVQQSGGGELRCTVTLDGTVIARGSASGPNAAVICAR